MNTKDFLGLTKRKFFLFVILSILLNLVFGPFGFLEVETINGGFSVYSLGFPFSSNFISQNGWDWNIYGLVGNVLVAYLLSCVMLLK